MAQNLVEIKVDENKLDRLKRQLSHIPNGINKVVARAINKVASSARTQVVRKISAESGAKQKAIRSAISLSRANYTKWLAVIRIKNKRVPLIKFGARQNKKGVAYKIPGGQSGFIASAFIQTMPKTGHKGVFIRKGVARLPIAEQFGPGIGSIYENAAGLAVSVMEQTYKDLNSQLDTQVKVLLNQVKR